MSLCGSLKGICLWLIIAIIRQRQLRRDMHLETQFSSVPSTSSQCAESSKVPSGLLRRGGRGRRLTFICLFYDCPPQRLVGADCRKSPNCLRSEESFWSCARLPGLFSQPAPGPCVWGGGASFRHAVGEAQPNEQKAMHWQFALRICVLCIESWTNPYHGHKDCCFHPGETHSLLCRIKMSHIYTELLLHS